MLRAAFDDPSGVTEREELVMKGRMSRAKKVGIITELWKDIDRGN